MVTIITTTTSMVMTIIITMMTMGTTTIITMMIMVLPLHLWRCKRTAGLATCITVRVLPAPMRRACRRHG